MFTKVKHIVKFNIYILECWLDAVQFLGKCSFLAKLRFPLTDGRVLVYWNVRSSGLLLTWSSFDVNILAVVPFSSLSKRYLFI